MDVGKQSTLNDLGDLKTHLEARIEDAKNINIGAVSQIESGMLVGGAFMDHRPNGAYHFDAPVMSGNPSAITTTFANGCGIYMTPTQTNADFAVMFFQNWSGESYAISKSSGAVTSRKILDTGNTITDVNGFIKAA